MGEIIIIGTDLKDFKKLQVNTRFYKSLGADFIIIRLSDDLNEARIKELFNLNDYYNKQGLGLGLGFDLKDLMAALLSKPASAIDFSDPKIRKSLYHFIEYLIKHGISFFNVEGLENLKSSSLGLFEAVRELNKNTFFNKEIISLGTFKNQSLDIRPLSNPKLPGLSLIGYEGQVRDLLKLSLNFWETGSGLCLTYSNFWKQGINFRNYPIYAKRMIYMTLFFLKSSLYVNESDLDFDDVIFLRKLFDLKSKIARVRGLRKILPKESEIIAFIRQQDDEKILFLANRGQNEVLIDIGYQVMDYKEYKYLLGSYTSRSLYRNILLRPYEAVAFIRSK
ncbi:alpha-glucosidase C-terminal domain-containing protein [Anaerococcus sp. NML200537]|uniref:alpha-glucosidase C-terminal domain-containing protein n=1 Tax=Anaerococcus sp. NML200537 TaxID=2954485 RepID=UPI002238B42E|nr:alpha-glucosidase C-terminal domain-containing protein [Anaerococcus sp. NML200537]MCW6702360.1 alpha-glucosidase C-terminal domain-containing protein [Anaerococcus sp. NML200537]